MVVSITRICRIVSRRVGGVAVGTINHRPLADARIPAKVIMHKAEFFLLVKRNSGGSNVGSHQTVESLDLELRAQGKQMKAPATQTLKRRQVK